MSAYKTEEVVFQVDGKPVSGYLVQPPNATGGILVLHAWWGLNPFFKQFCDRLAAGGFTILAPDLNQGKIANTVEEAEKLMNERDFRLTRAAALGAVDFLRQQPGLAESKLGVVGFSMGAAWALFLASAVPDVIAAVSLFYGTNEVDFSTVKAEFQGHFAEKDDWEPQEGVRKMEEDMHKAGLKAEFYHYPGAGHWFFESDRPDAYQPAAAAMAWVRTLKFFKDRIY